MASTVTSAKSTPMTTAATATTAITTASSAVAVVFMMLVYDYFFGRVMLFGNVDSNMNAVTKETNITICKYI